MANRDRRSLLVIDVTEPADEVIAKAMSCLLQGGGIYQRAGELVQVVPNVSAPLGADANVSPLRIERIHEGRLYELLAGCAVWIAPPKPYQRSRRKIDPPPRIVRAIHQRGIWPGIPYLAGIVGTPVLLGDGSVLTTPGFHAASGLVYAPPPHLNVDVPETPSAEDARAAATFLLDLVEDFPFSEPVAGRSAWLSAVLTALSYQALAGPAPIYVIDGNSPGCGKSLLCDLVAAIAIGEPMARQPAPGSDAEMSKLITSIALEGDSLVLLDNLSGPLGWPSLDAALTGRAWRDRLLGHSRTTGRIALRMCWFATGNNVVFAADVVRRTMCIRLDTPDEHPEERTQFKYPAVLQHILQRRSAYISAALTILRAYCVAGRPAMSIPNWGSYEAWSSLVRSAVVWAGCGDPLAARRTFARVADDGRARLAGILDGWQVLMRESPQGLTVGEAIDRLGPSSTPNDCQALTTLRQILVDVGGSPISSQKVGTELRRHLRQAVNGLRLDCLLDPHQNVQRWSVVRI